MRVAAEAVLLCCGLGGGVQDTCSAAVLQCLVAAARDATRPCAVIVTQQYRRMQYFSRVKSAARRRMGTRGKAGS